MLGRLAYLSSLRNSSTGKYEHVGLSDRVGTAAADQVLQQSHLDLFQEWLCYGLSRQKDELAAYLSELEGNKRDIIAYWLCVEPYSTWIPAACRDVERRLFYTDLEVVLELIRTEYGVASRDPDS